ncbi:hypothetical protein KIN20_017018 [Parelaphostrongylus tenuis]|uniref:Uncharacterized protein n=1 Tax=Parelaphostrongylus tenuis TaxID=148309 RepID=A0AAD5QTI4_PARTN|nr:hypothetical protein KIN20_017018 [Parelaphostrongylus tenuis]
MKSGSEEVAELDSLRTKSVSTKSKRASSRDVSMEGNDSCTEHVSLELSASPVHSTAEEGISSCGDKQPTMALAVPSMEDTSDSGKVCESPSCSKGGNGRGPSSAPKNEEEHVTKAKHDHVEVDVDVSVSMSKLSLESENVDEIFPEISTYESSKAVTLAKSSAKHSLKRSLPESNDASDSEELLKFPTLDSSSQTSQKSNVCFTDEAKSTQEFTQLPHVGDVIEASSDAGQKYIQLQNFKHLFRRPKFFRKDFDSALNALYHFSFGLETRTNDLPSKFITNDVETVWQSISYRGKQITKEFRKRSTFLEDDLVLQDRSVLNSEENSDVDDGGSASNDGLGHTEDDEVDLLNLNDEDLKDLERELEDMRHEEPEANKSIKPFKKYPKSVVDDDFFSLAEMNAFLDEQDRIGHDSENILDTDDDSWTGETNYFYDDFFGEEESVMENQSEGYQMCNTKGQILGAEKERLKKTKTVRFAIDVTGPKKIVEEANTHEDEELDNTPVLLGEEDELKEPESNLKRSLKRLKQTIAKLEEENLAPRSWELSGEVTAQQRTENELLEKDVQFEHGTKKAPEITELFTEKLEELIRQRIKDKAFDDVVRKKRVEERMEVYRSQAIEEQEMLKTSLAEVYEKEYEKAAGDVKTPDAVNEQHAAIEKQMRELFRLIDALSNFDYTPPEVRPEIRVVSNMPALRVEEVGMIASTDEQLLAPEEMKKPQKGDLKSTDELDRTDKLRQRRKKKNRQRALVEVFGKDVLERSNTKKKKKRGINDDGSNDTEKVKSSNFFTKLQETVRNEIKEKTVKKKKVKSEQVSQNGAKYIL